MQAVSWPCQNDDNMRNKMKLNLIAIALVCGGLSACGGGDNVSANDGDVIANIKSSNIEFSSANRPAGTWRWLGTPQQHVSVYVTPPAAGNATELDYSGKTQNAIAQINAKLRGLLVLDAVNSIPASGNYIHVSYGTSYVPPNSTDYASYCANVATGKNMGNPIQPGSQNGIGSNPVYLNLGNGHCNVTQDIVTHEFGHALGLANHFNGFGNGPAISAAYWDVLATLYANPQSTTAANLSVRRVVE